MACVDYRSLLLACVVIFCGCASAEYGDVSFQQKLMDRIEVLEIQGKEQAKLLATQKESMMTMEAELADQSQKLLRQGETNREYKQRLGRQDEAIREYKHRLGQLEKTVAHLQSAAEPTTELSEERDVESDRMKDPEQERQSIMSTLVTAETKPKRALVNSEGPVAFHAVIQNGGEVSHIGVHQNIVFPDVLLNSAGGYHNQHGVFIAPKAGLYIFSTSIMSYYTVHQMIYVHLMKNGQVLANAYAHGDSGRHDQGSVTVVTRLAVGDEVWVSLYGPADTSLWGESYDTFMGCLVIPE